MAKNPVRFGIIGCAGIAGKLARAISLSPNTTLSAVGSRFKEKAQRFAAKHKLPKSVTRYSEATNKFWTIQMWTPCTSPSPPLSTCIGRFWPPTRRSICLLEKPAALNVAELDRIIEACESNGVQFMDGTMWLHNPRTARLKLLLSDSTTIGPVNFVHTISTWSETDEFFESNIRVKPDLGALGALGDLGWYCIGASLWAKDYQLPATVTALPDVTRNAAGVILSCSAILQWDQPKQTQSTIHCSFVSHTTMDLAICGSNGSVHLKDFIIPYKETSASFEFTSGAKFVDLHIGWNVTPEEVHVDCEFPQEVVMVQELARLIEGITDCGSSPSSKWPEISRKTQLVLDAVNKSIEFGCKPVSL